MSDSDEGEVPVSTNKANRGPAPVAKVTARKSTGGVPQPQLATRTMNGAKKPRMSKHDHEESGSDDDVEDDDDEEDLSDDEDVAPAVLARKDPKNKVPAEVIDVSDDDDDDDVDEEENEDISDEEEEDDDEVSEEDEGQAGDGGKVKNGSSK